MNAMQVVERQNETGQGRDRVMLPVDDILAISDDSPQRTHRLRSRYRLAMIIAIAPMMLIVCLASPKLPACQIQRKDITVAPMMPCPIWMKDFHGVSLASTLGKGTSEKYGQVGLDMV